MCLETNNLSKKNGGKNSNPLFKMTFISCVRFVGHIKSLFERTNGCHNPQKVVCRHKVHFKFKQIIQQSCYPIFKTFFMSQQAPFMGDIYWTILVLLHHYYKARGNGWRFSGSLEAQAKAATTTQLFTEIPFMREWRYSRFSFADRPP